MLNNNFGELVKKYEKYTRERRQKKLLSLLLLAAIIAVGFFFISKSEFIVNSFKKTSPEEVTEQPAQNITKVTTPKSEEVPTKINKPKETKIEKSNPFQLEVKERKNLYALLTQDKEQNSYQSAVNVANFYFEEHDYEKAVTWAVKASKKDPKQSRPWILYAKSKVSLGKTKVAKKALSIYLKHTPSKEVQNLLDSL